MAAATILTTGLAATTTTFEAFGILASIAGFILLPFGVNFKLKGGKFDGGSGNGFFSSLFSKLLKYLGGLIKSLVAFFAVLKLLAMNLATFGKTFISFLLGTKAGMLLLGSILAVWLIFTYFAPLCLKKTKKQLRAVKSLYLYTSILSLAITLGVLIGWKNSSHQAGYFENKRREASKEAFLDKINKVQASTDLSVDDIKKVLPSTDFLTPFKNWFKSPNRILTPKNALMSIGFTGLLFVDLIAVLKGNKKIKLCFLAGNSLLAIGYAVVKFDSLSSFFKKIIK